MVTIKELQKRIAKEREKVEEERKRQKLEIEKEELGKELFKLKNRKVISAGGKAKRIFRRVGKTVLATGQKAAPILKRQAELIRQQQLRDEAVAKKLRKGGNTRTKKLIKTRRIPKSKTRNIQKTLKKINAGKIKKKRRRKRETLSESNLSVFAPLDF